MTHNNIRHDPRSTLEREDGLDAGVNIRKAQAILLPTFPMAYS
jgi:hypothetical protein